MPYLIDGHNLIPHIEGLSLADPDDEMRLVTVLRRYCQRHGRQVEVFFDKAPPGQAKRRRFGPVVAHFVRQGDSADAAIRRRLQRLGRETPNWTVVSSDREVQAAARGARARSLTSEAFAAEIAAVGEELTDEARAKPEMDSQELETWLRLFQQGEAGQEDE